MRDFLVGICLLPVGVLIGAILSYIAKKYDKKTK